MTKTFSLFCVATGLLLLFIPLFLFPFFPSHDGPAHVNSAVSLIKLKNGDPLFLEYFRSIPSSMTNWFGAELYRSLLQFISPQYVDTYGIIFYVAFSTIVLHLCGHLLLHIPSSRVILFYPLIFTGMLHMGSYNLSLAISSSFIIIAACISYVRTREPKYLLAICIGLVLTFLIHVQVALLSLFLVAICGLGIALKTYLDSRRPRQAIFELFKLFCTTIPSVLLIGIFILKNTSHVPSHPYYDGLISRFIHIVFLTGIQSYSLFGLLISAFLFGCIVVTVCFTISSSKQTWLLFCACGLSLMILFLPDGLGDAFQIAERIMPSFLLIIFSWIVIQAKTDRYWKVLIVGSIFILSLQTIDRIHALFWFNEKVKQFTDVKSCLPNGSAYINLDMDVIAQKSFSQSVRNSVSDPLKVNMNFGPFTHLPGSVYAEQEIVDASNYEAMNICPYFRLKYQSWLSRLFGDLDLGERAILENKTGALKSFIEGLHHTNYPIQYLILSSFEDDKTDAAIAVQKVINDNYYRICSSSSNEVQIFHLINEP